MRVKLFVWHDFCCAPGRARFCKQENEDGGFKMKLKRLVTAASVAAALCLASVSAHAAFSFTFSQTGFSGGGSLTGTFTGTDLDGNGQLSAFAGEISGYSMSFSGDSLIPDFSHTFADLSGLVYDLGSGFIGDGDTIDVEGIASNWFGVAGFDYATGLGPTGGFGGRVIDIATGAESSTPNLVVVAQVPEPGTLAVLVLGLAGLAASRRRNQ
jgi:hypothetical protein